MTKYTIVDFEGAPLAHGLSLADAAHAVMTSDGREWVIELDGDSYVASGRSRNSVASAWTKFETFRSFKSDPAEAKQEIYEQIVNTGRMDGHDEAIPDEVYRRGLVDFLEHNEGDDHCEVVRAQLAEFDAR